MDKWLVIREKGNVIVTILYNRNNDKYQFVNLTSGHICSCLFDTLQDAFLDMIDKFNNGEIYFRNVNGGFANLRPYSDAINRYFYFPTKDGTLALKSDVDAKLSYYNLDSSNIDANATDFSIGLGIISNVGYVKINIECGGRRHYEHYFCCQWPVCVSGL